MLKRKMLRDIKNNLSQFITIFLMVMIGVMAYSGIEAYMTGMQVTADRFYKDNNLQDMNVIANNVTEEDLDAIKNIEHVNDAERKLSVTATTPDDDTMLVSFIESNDISVFHVFDGVEFDADTDGAWLDRFYAVENNIKVGDTITFKYDGYEFKEEVKGLVNIPDHVYDVKDESELFPDHKEFGFVYLSSKELEGYVCNKAVKETGLDEEKLRQTGFDYRDELIFTTAMVDIDKESNYTKVKENIEKNIENAIAVVDIKDTTSYRTYQGEIDEGKTYVGVFSGLFLFIAMLSVVTTMTRVVKKQKIQIGTLKALGFSDRSIVTHYVGYGVWISVFASIAGLIAGYFGIGNMFISMEMDFFQIPDGKPILKMSSYICAVLVIMAVAVVSYIACYKELKANPADTLRNEIPNVKTGTLDITTKGIFKKMSFSTKWNVRDMLRNKARTVTGIVGILGCCMLMVCAIGMLNTMNHFIKWQYSDLLNFEYKMSLKEGTTEEQLQKLKDTYGDSTSQSYLIEYKDKDGEKQSNNIFITDAGDMVRFENEDGEYIKIHSDKGIYVTRKLAEKEKLKVGDKIKWHLVGSSEYYESEIVGLNKDPQNQNITMTREYFESLGNEYTPDTLYTNENLAGVKEVDNVQVVQNIKDLEKGMNNMLNTLKSMISLIIVVAILLGVVIIYNLGVLSYTEKQYQFATLKVLGFDDRKIRGIFVRQNNIISVISILFGLPAGYMLTDFILKMALEESFDFGAYINPETYVMAAVGTFAVIFVVGKILSAKVNVIDMVSSLKGNE